MGTKTHTNQSAHISGDYNPRISWVLKPRFCTKQHGTAILQPTYIVGTKTQRPFSWMLVRIHYNPRISWVLKPKYCTHLTSPHFHYNPRISWVLKPAALDHTDRRSGLQPTYIVGTKTSWHGCRFQKRMELQPTYIVGTKTGSILEQYHGGNYNPRISWVLKRLHPQIVTHNADYNPRISWVLKPALLTPVNGVPNYNPRISWVLKPVSYGENAALLELQPTYIVGTKTKRPNISWKSYRTTTYVYRGY